MMMRKILFAISGLALLLTACSSKPLYTSDGKAVHWKRPTTAEVVVNFRVAPSADILYPWISQNAGEWNAAANVKVTAAKGSCTGVTNCVPITGEVRNGGVTSIGWYSDGHVASASIRFDNSAGQATLNVDNGTCHEMGHALALAHGDEPGPCQLGHPTSDDLALVRLLHNHVD